MNHEEVLRAMQDFIDKGNGLVKENKVYIIPEISEEGDAFFATIIPL